MICGEKGCTNEAEFSYVWPWGEPGVCCSLHRVTLQQKAVQQIKRGPLHFTVLEPNKVKELPRDERTQYRAQLITAQEDLESARRTIKTLHDGNAAMVDQIRDLRNIKTRLETEVKQLQASLDEALAQRDKANADCGAAVAEAQRLEVLVRNAATQPDNVLGAPGT